MASRASQDLEKKGLPANPDAERFVLGCVMLNPQHMERVETALSPDDFSLEPNRRIFARMKDLRDRNEAVDRMTIANELMRQGQLESVGGLTYLIGLDDGLPNISNIDSYIQIVKEKSALRKIIFVSQQALESALSGAYRPGELITSLGDRIAEIGSGEIQHGDGGQTPEEVITSFPGGLTAFLDPLSQQMGIDTGITKLDDVTGGFHNGELSIIAARPGHGKSALLLSVAEHIALNKRKFMAIFTMEMSAATMLTRLACMRGFVSYHRFRLGLLDKEERHKLQVALNEIMESRLKFYDTGGVTINDIETRVRRLKKEEGLHVAGIDYLQLMNGNGRTDNRNQELNIVTRRLKLLAMSCGIPIILLSQLARTVERRGSTINPMLSDLKDTGGAESDSDVVIFIVRDELYKLDGEKFKGEARFIIGKNRHGPITTVRARFARSWIKFLNKAGDDREEPAID